MENSICDQFQDNLKKFKEWIETQPQLPQNMNELLILRFLKVCDFDHVKAGQLLLYNLELRKNHPHIFTDRDLNSEKIQTALKTIRSCPLPSYTKEKRKISIFRLVDENPHQYDPVDGFKLFFMMSDVRYITPDSIGLTEGEIGIMDFKGFTFRHFLKVATNLSSTRLYLKYVQEAVPFKIYQNHFVNCSPALSKIMTLIRPFVKKELFDAMHFHTSYESLYEYVPKKDLPEEYGGEAGKIDDIFKKWLKVVEDQKEYLSNDSNWKLSE